MFSLTCVLYLLASFAFGVAFGTWIGRRAAELTIARAGLTDDEIATASRAYLLGMKNGRGHKNDSSG